MNCINAKIKRKFNYFLCSILHRFDKVKMFPTLTASTPRTGNNSLYIYFHGYWWFTINSIRFDSRRHFNIKFDFSSSFILLCRLPMKHLNPISFRFVSIFVFVFTFIFHLQQSFDIATKSLFIRHQHFSVWITVIFFFTKVLPFSMVSASDCFYSHRRKYSFINVHFTFFS